MKTGNANIVEMVVVKYKSYETIVKSESVIHVIVNKLTCYKYSTCKVVV